MTTIGNNRVNTLESAIDSNQCIYAQFHLNYPRQTEQAFRLDVDIRLPGRGVTAIFGQSGSGKTSLLRCIAGLEQIPAGQLRVNGRVWQDKTQFLPTHKRPLAYVFQEASLFAHLSVRKNLAYASKRAEQAPTPELYEGLLSLLGIEHLLEKQPGTLSGGERQRVAIARAMLIQPEILLMDEPLAALDDQRKQEILPYLESLRDRFDIPILYVSHSVEEVSRLADHVVLLDQGRVVAQGDVQTVFSSLDLPIQFGQDRGVVIHGRVSEVSEQWQLATVDIGHTQLVIPNQNFQAEQAVRLRLLAKDISITLEPAQQSSILNTLEANVLEIAEQTSGAMALVQLAVGEHILLARLTRKSVSQLQLNSGKPVFLQLKSVAVIS